MKPKTIYIQNKTISKDFEQMRKDQRFTDVQLQGKGAGKIFPAHKIVLISRSTYFDKMFQNFFVEDRKSLVKLSDITSDILGYVLDFIYMGEVSIPIDNDINLLADIVKGNLQGLTRSTPSLVFYSFALIIRNCILIISI